MKMKKGRKLISMLMLFTLMVSAPATSVQADPSIGRVERRVETVTQSYTGGSSQVYAHLITRADGTEVRYVYSNNYLNAPGSEGWEDSFSVLKSVLTADYAALIPDTVDEGRNGQRGFFFCSDPSLEEYVNDNWTSAEYVARNFLTVKEKGKSYNYNCEGEGAGGAINTSATAERQNNWFDLIKTLADEAAQYQLNFGGMTVDDIRGKRDMTDSQIDLVVGVNLDPSYIIEEGQLVQLTNIDIIDHVATIYSEHATISESSSDDKKDKKKDSSKKHHKHSSDSSSEFVANPDAIVAFYIVNGAVDGKAKLGRQEQGAVCKSLFTASCPKGWTEAFSMSMSYDGVYTSTLKNGTLKLYIPAQYQKDGRQYAVMAMDKYGKVHIYQDTDALPFVFASPLNFEGYAFSVIYKD